MQFMENDYRDQLYYEIEAKKQFLEIASKKKSKMRKRKESLTEEDPNYTPIRKDSNI